MSAVDQAADLLRGKRLLVLSGAGLSTDSGIPDYRGPASPPRSPMTYQEFISGPVAQQRYWARSHIGWRTMLRAEPNDGHREVAGLETAGVVDAVITQNVDGLHQGAGSRNVIDLHGRLDCVLCLSCGRRSSRGRLDDRLAAANPGFTEVGFVEVAPDGDAVVSDVSAFRLVGCEICGGWLKPDVIFFGENVPRDRVDHCFALLESVQALLVVGSSLTVQSGLRFVRRAHALDFPVVIINRGVTRGDALADLRLHAGCSETLLALRQLLLAGEAVGG